MPIVIQILADNSTCACNMETLEKLTVVIRVKPLWDDAKLKTYNLQGGSQPDTSYCVILEKIPYNVFVLCHLNNIFTHADLPYKNIGCTLNIADKSAEKYNSVVDHHKYKVVFWDGGI